ncbi:pentapeptide repeat-containing protein [Chroococcus sp. FPU101]|uniref:pentapeptide repeat-containing protein n=1 Tax=Chroococcus sp. FPU101 TaxID=1974212 RepID=UPI001A906B43|nr:pentapeptide repeat-containing protein [Chroococcus sp. FPU101]GFE67921.1 hypothetical protein CFPU101_05310 [Chroococcus sp. FPU101]
MNSFDAEKIKERFLKLRDVKNPYEKRCELFRIARDFNLTLEEIKVLWEDYNTPEARHRKNFIVDFFNDYKNVLSVAETILKFSIFTGAILFIAEAGTREKKAINDSWQILNEVQNQKSDLGTQKVSSGAIGALEFLNRGCVEKKEWLWPFNTEIIRDKLPILKYFFANCVEINNVNLSQMYLSNVSLNYSTLNNTKFQNSNLTESQLRQANLQDSELSGADLTQSDLKGVDLSFAKLVATNLTHTNLQNAIFLNAI